MVTKDHRKLEVRLWGIDAPEYDQPGSGQARNALKELVENKTLLLDIKYKDTYGRSVAVAVRGTVNVNEQLVRDGHAWVHIYYCKESPCEKWSVLEEQARAHRVGLWSTEAPVSPWVWKSRRASRKR